MMDLYFEPDKGTPFGIEVGYFDTMKEIKEKVTKYHGIPVHEQTLIFKGRILPDDLNIHNSNIFDSSHLKLMINSPTRSTATTNLTTDPQQAPPPPPPPPHITTTATTITKVKIEETFSPSSCSSSQKIKLFLKTFRVAIEMDPNDSVLKLKEKINEMEGIPFSRMIVHSNGNQLHDRKTLHECQLVDDSEVEITLKPPTPTPTMTITTTTTTTTTTALCNLSMNLMGHNNYSKKLKVNVMTKCGDEITLEVNPLSNVGELRKELQKVRSQGVGFRLPKEGYFFIYKQNVMEEDQSFRWHQVAQGDTIETFNGCVTGGS